MIKHRRYDGVTVRVNGGMKQKTLPAKYYTDPRIFAREMERFYGRRWICAGRVEAIPHPAVSPSMTSR